MSVGGAVPIGHCPECGKNLLRRAPAGTSGLVLMNKFLRVEADGQAVIGCKSCGTELQAKRRGRLLLFRRHHRPPS